MVINKIKNDFTIICNLAEDVNSKLKRTRFHASYSPADPSLNQSASYCLYDSDTKKYILLDAIMFTGHYNYSKQETPKEFHEMKQMLLDE